MTRVTPARLLQACGLALLVGLCAPGLRAQTGTDQDGDGFTVEAGDCNDGNPDVHPGAPEVCNGVDDDCDTQTDEGNPGGGAACSTGQLAGARRGRRPASRAP
jgi:hypothetical protein